MSPRNFARVFLPRDRRDAGQVHRAGAHRAAHGDTLEDDAAVDRRGGGDAAASASAERMRRTFRRHLRVVPQDYRRRFERASA